MSTDKGDSDLDVFDSLLPPEPPGRVVLDEKKTLLGVQAPTYPPVPGSLAPVPANVPSTESQSGSQELRRPPAATGAHLKATVPKAPPNLSSLPAGAKTVPAPPEGASGSSPGPLSLDDWVTRPPTPPPSFSGDAPADKPPSNPGRGIGTAAVSGNATVPQVTADADTGWEDDDDKTTIYDKETPTGAQDLLRPLSPPSGHPPPPMSRPPGAILVPTEPNAPRVSATQDTAFIPVAAPGMNRWLAYAVAVVVAACFGLAVFFLLPKKGSLHITVTGPGNRAIPGVEVLINGQLRCTSSPCEVRDLKRDTYLVVARAPGYQPTGEIAVDVSDAQSVKNITLARFIGTGVHVLGEGSGLVLSVDGREIGPLPQALREMDPGEHVIQVSGGERYADFTQRVLVESDRMSTVGPVKLKVIKGLATIVPGPGAEGADITLRVGNSKKVLPVPIKLEVDTSRSHIVVAKRRGYQTFQQPIEFEDGQAERTIEITLLEESASPRARSRRRGSTRAARDTAADGRAVLNLNSTPPSNVVLDGKPLGSTPHVGLTVDPGTHSVLFIHGNERERRSVEVGEGAEKTVSVQF